MKKLVVAFAMASGMGLLGAQQASAATITYNFCGFVGESASCSDGHTGITEWSIAFTDIVDGDPNNYTAVVTLTSTNAGSIYMDSFDWNAGKDFEVLPTLTGVTGDGTALPGAYTVSNGKVNSGGSDGCSVAGTARDLCTELTGAGNAPNINGTQTWTYAVVDFVDADGVLTTSSSVNLRALFDGTAAAGGTKVGAILSPEGNYLTTTNPTTSGVTPTGVPEPMFLSLLGVGLAALVYRRRQA